MRGAPTIKWEEVDGEELGWAVGDPDYTPYDRFKGRGGLVRGSRPTSGGRGPSASMNFSGRQATCRLFNDSGVCRFGDSCRFAHKCTRCGSLHPAKSCRN